MNVHFVDQLINFFGEGFRFINLVRDGRDVVTSRHPEHPSSYWVPPSRWIRDVEAGRRHEGRQQVLTIRYEDLVDDYLDTLEKICRFIDEPCSRAFEAYPDTATVQSSGAWFKEASSVTKRSEQRWKKPEHKDVIDKFMSDERVVGLLKHYGYLQS